MPFEITADVPPQDGAGESFQLTLQIESNGTPLGAADVETINFGLNLVATRGLSGDPNRVDVSAPGGGGGGDAESIPDVVTDGTTDNLAVMIAALGPTGSYVTAAKPRAKFGTTGSIKLNGLLDVHPSLSIANDARGVNVLRPGNNLPATTAAIAGNNPPSGIGDGSGADAAFIRIPRDTADTSQNLAYSCMWRGVNIDATGTTQTNPTHGVRFPNPDPSENPFDPDPGFQGNKDYVAGEWYNMDIVGWPGSGMVGEASNGRLHLHSVRALNNGRLDVSGMNHGFDLGGNDIVVTGHSAAGGNRGSGFKVGQASGFFATTVNVWGNSGSRSVTCQAVWINQRKLFAWGFSEFNDWVRLDGGVSYWRGGTIALNCFAPFNGIFDDDGVAFDFTDGGPDPRLQASIGAVEYQSVNYICNQYFRSTAVNGSSQPGGAFASWQNVGGDLTGKFGTAFNKFIDLSANSMANAFDPVNSAPNVKPWTGRQAVFTVTIAAPGVFTSVAHGLLSDDQVVLTTTGALPTGLSVGITLFVIAISADTFQLARLPSGTPITTTGAQSGVHRWGILNTLPYDTHGGAQLNFALMDSFKNETRLGSMGRTHSKLLLGVSNTDFGALTSSTATFTAAGNVATAVAHGMDDGAPLTLTTSGTLPAPLVLGAQYWVTHRTADTFQFAALPGDTAITLTDAGTGTHTFWSWARTYQIEAGERTLMHGAPARNALHGAWELDNAVQYTDRAYDTRATIDGGTRTVDLGQVYELLTTAGGGIASYTIVLPTDLPASYEFVVEMTGGPIAALAFTTAPTPNKISASSFALPTSSPGAMTVRFLYRRSANQWYVTSVQGGASAAAMGRIDGASSGATGVVGEIQQVTVLSASAVALTSTVSADVTSLLLPPGNWLVYGMAGYIGTTVTPTALQHALSTVSATLPGIKDNAYGTVQLNLAAVSSIFWTGNLGPTFVKVTVATTIYLVANAVFTGTSCAAYGQILAQRVQ